MTKINPNRGSEMQNKLFFLLATLSLSSLISCKPTNSPTESQKLSLMYNSEMTYIEKISSLDFVSDYQFTIESITGLNAQATDSTSDIYYFRVNLKLIHEADAGWVNQDDSTEFHNFEIKMAGRLGDYQVAENQTIKGTDLAVRKSITINKSDIVDHVSKAVIKNNIDPDDVLLAIEVSMYQKIEGNDEEKGWLDSDGGSEFSRNKFPARTIDLVSSKLSFKPIN